jgi:hypothetical protein
MPNKLIYKLYTVDSTVSLWFKAVTIDFPKSYSAQGFLNPFDLKGGNIRCTR